MDIYDHMYIVPDLTGSATSMSICSFICLQVLLPLVWGSKRWHNIFLLNRDIVLLLQSFMCVYVYRLFSDFILFLFQEKPVSGAQYNLVAYLAYLLYAPLYIAGPIITFNAFASQVFSLPCFCNFDGNVSKIFMCLLPCIYTQKVVTRMRVTAICGFSSNRPITLLIFLLLLLFSWKMCKELTVQKILQFMDCVGFSAFYSWSSLSIAAILTP